MHPLLDLALRPVVGHRGNCAHAPENTLESFRQGVALGVDALELDVRRSADGEVVVFHDPVTDRMTGEHGIVSSLTLRELRALDAGATFSSDGGRTYPYRGHGIGIPTLAEVLAAFPETPLLIELKTVDVAAPARAVIERAGAEARCIVASFQRAALPRFDGSAIARAAHPQEAGAIALPALCGQRFRALPFQVMSLPTHHRALPVPLRALARAAAPAGVPVHVWTINDPAMARRLWRVGVRGILSDDPRTILAARAAFEQELERGFDKEVRGA